MNLSGSTGLSFVWSLERILARKGITDKNRSAYNHRILTRIEKGKVDVSLDDVVIGSFIL
ncbi:hypothetical protein [Leptospira sp. GIMC2001]|uniref:hypothetical protein n=1 Tax=Leptospira sp. GIMC2001 TaxID=1513297 RepID=UPI00234BCAE0|nr:hypothetical protein [Leptospira sp. GIMC2001]WCL51486.1 hypothetical protein O4O04_19925 [Leptospira sp. GIMC2001]